MLKVLMLRKQLNEARAQLEKVRTAGDGFATREQELATAIEDANTDEERTAVEEAVEAFDAQRGENAAEQARLAEEIAGIEAEIKKIEEAAPAENRTAEREENTMPNQSRAIPMDIPLAVPYSARERVHAMLQRARSTGREDAEAHKPVIERQDVQAFLQRVRTLGGQQRAVKSAEIFIPTVMLDILRDNISRYSKLIKYVRSRPVHGKSRQPIAGTVPEAIWTEMCARLNELDIQFNMVEVDGYKVGGYVVVCNALLEDSDLNLAAEILDMLGQSIGYALDKAMVYGTGTKMPLGFITRLAQTAEPTDYPALAPTWEDLHTTNLVKLAANLDGVKFFQAFIEAAGNASSKYSGGAKFWAMSEKTHATLLSKALAFNAAGAIVGQLNNTMPVVGGAIEELDFIPDGDIVGGYGDLYLLAERAGTSLAQSEHVQFIEENTVFKGTARYDGMPAIAKGFVGVNIENAAVTTSVSFPPDTANPADEDPDE